VIYYERNRYSTIQDHKDYQDISKLYVFRDAKVFPIVEMKIVNVDFNKLDIVQSKKLNNS